MTQACQSGSPRLAATCCNLLQEDCLADLWDVVAVGRHASEPKTRADSPTGTGNHLLLHSKHLNCLYYLMSILITKVEEDSRSGRGQGKAMPGSHDNPDFVL